jgi:hypothetical protein
MFRRLLPLTWLLGAVLAALPLGAQAWEPPQQTGDAATAEKYAEWIQAAIDQGQWTLVEEALERAADYADVSSDLSYLLALTRIHQERPWGAVLESLGRSLAADRWNRYSSREARLLEAVAFIAIRAYGAALESLSRAGESEGVLCQRSLAFRGLMDSRGFLQTIAAALDRYPRSPLPVRIIFGYAANKIPDSRERDLISACLRRLPQLLEADPELAYLAVPFIRDTEEGRRLVSAYRAAGGANPAGLPAALNLGVIDENQAAEELFRASVLDKDLIESVWNLLSSRDGRERFGSGLSRFSGIITEDIDRDGHPESRTRYENGIPQTYSYDADQDRLPELELSFFAGIPVRAELAVDRDGETQPGNPDRPRVVLEWEQYPSVFRAELESIRYIPRPGEFFFNPLQLKDLLGSALLYPERERIPRLSRRTLVSFALTIERPSREIPGGVEQIEMNRGIPQRAREYLQGRLVSETEFLLGQALIQRIDMDLDGRMETIRHFKRDELPAPDPLAYSVTLASSESDWDGDGIFEYKETYTDDLVIRAWDMERDGIKEYTESGARN